MKNGLFINVFGDKVWYKNNQVHRIGSPAYYYGEYKRYWYENDHINNINGPAVIWWGKSQNSGYHWYISGNDITNALLLYCSTNNIDINDYTNINKSDKLKLKIKFGLIL